MAKPKKLFPSIHPFTYLAKINPNKSLPIHTSGVTNVYLYRANALVIVC
ncbi:MAG TPA: hypothetical protein PKH16_03730 [Aequorivita sp.]|nr:hypothetical protein [Aequorivita sp.]